MSKERVRSPEIEEAILAGVAGGEGLETACRRLGVVRRTVRGWEERDPEFAARLGVARKHGLEVLADQILEISDAVRSSDSAAEVNAARLAVESRKWLLSKLHPEQYGDRVELTGKDGKDLLPSGPEIAVPKLMQVLAVLLPQSNNSKLFELANTMVSRLNGSSAQLTAESEDGEEH